MALNYQELINNQLELSFVPPQNFYMILGRIPTTSYMLQRIQVPVLSADEIIQSNPMNPSRTMIPGSSLEYSVLSCDFIIDKYHKNYKEILKWLKNNYAPEDKERQWDSFASSMSDIDIVATDSANKIIGIWHFVDAFPISMDGPMYDATMPDIEYLTSNVTFRFKYFTFSSFTEGVDDNDPI